MAKVLGTKEAFKKLIETKGINNNLGVTRFTVSNWKRALEGRDDKNMPTLNKMEEMLIKAGASVVKEKVWKLPA
jgi:hypothetical protein